LNEATPSNANAGRVHIYSGSNGARLRTINPPTVQVIGTFGWAVAGMPDVTGDGRGDLLIGGMWETDTANMVCGRAYLYSGANGSLVRAWLSPNRQEGGGFGCAIAWIPDVNGDAVPDVVIGASGERSNSGLISAGRAYVYSGATGVWLRTLNSPNPDLNGNFGFAVAGVPDVNGDGRGDIIIGCPHENPGSTPYDAGRVYVFSGATGALIRAMGSPFTQVDGHFGQSVVGLKDINGDGRGDIAIGAPWQTPAGSVYQSGMVHVFSGATGAGLKHLMSPTPNVKGYFGMVISAVPDVNNDGREDLAVGSIHETAGATQSGRAFIFSLPAGSLLKTMVSPHPDYQGEFGASVTGISDTNGDGKGDVVVGAPFENRPAAMSNSGAAYLFR
jgi:hypothetical protein